MKTHYVNNGLSYSIRSLLKKKNKLERLMLHFEYRDPVNPYKVVYKVFFNVFERDHYFSGLTILPDNLPTKFS